jgi:hypothetical protein
MQTEIAFGLKSGKQDGTQKLTIVQIFRRAENRLEMKAEIRAARLGE